MKKFRLPFLLSFSIALTACGGGGGEESTPPTGKDSNLTPSAPADPTTPEQPPGTTPKATVETATTPQVSGHEEIVPPGVPFLGSGTGTLDSF